MDLDKWPDFKPMTMKQHELVNELLDSEELMKSEKKRFRKYLKSINNSVYLGGMVIESLLSLIKLRRLISKEKDGTISIVRKMNKAYEKYTPEQIEAIFEECNGI